MDQKPRTPVVARDVNVPKAPPKDAKSRRFSKRITVASLFALFALAGYGTYAQYPQTADVIDALGPWVLGLIVVYMGVGHLDLRAVLGKSFGDVIMALVRRRRRKPADDGFGGYPGGGLD